MGGGVSRLDETVWEESANATATDTTCSDGGLDPRSLVATVDGVLPTARYRFVELRKTHMGQREYEIVDSFTEEVLYRTVSVPGTLAWFDVISLCENNNNDTNNNDDNNNDTTPTTNFNQPVLRVRALDHLRKTWIVYRYDHPVFEGQRPIPNTTNGGGESNENENNNDNCKNNNNNNTADAAAAAFKGLSGDTKLYKTACLTVSWSRCVVVAARYGRPEPEDWKHNDEIGSEHEIEIDGLGETQINNSSSNNNNNDSAENFDKDKGDINQNDNSNTDGDDEFITPREMMKLQQEEDEEQLEAGTATNCGGVEESKSDETDECNGEQDMYTPNDPNNDIAKNNDEDDSSPCHSSSSSPSFDDTATNHRPKQYNNCRKANASNNNQRQPRPRNALSIDQTKQIRSRFGDWTTTTTETVAEKQQQRHSVATKLAKESSSLLQSSKHRILASFSSFRKSRNPPPPPTTTTTTTPIGREEEEAQENYPQDHQQAREIFLNGEREAGMPRPATGREETSAVLIETDEADVERETRDRILQQQQQQHYELAMQGVLDLDGDQPIVQCQEISNKMMGNHQTFNMTKEDLLVLLKLETESREDTPETTAATKSGVQASSNIDESGGDDGGDGDRATQPVNNNDEPTRQSWFSKRKRPLTTEGNETNPETAKPNATKEEKEETTVISERTLSNNSNRTASEAQPKSGLSIQAGLKWLSANAKDNNSKQNKNNSNNNNNTNEEGGESAIVTSVDSASSLSSVPTCPTEVTTADVDDGNDDNASTVDRDNPSKAISETAAKDHGDTISGGCDTDTANGEMEGDKAYYDNPRSTNHELSSPGDGIEESKEEVGDREEKHLGQTTTEQTNGPDGYDEHSVHNATTTPTIATNEEQNDNLLVSYFFWKHTSLNLGKHKMHMHLAKHSDLALHVVLAIVANQVRTERNHAVLLATGIHPSWLFIDPRNPRATIS